MPVNGKLLEILCCPVSKTPLTVLGRQKLDKLNNAIKSGEALFVDGEKVTDPLQELIYRFDAAAQQERDFSSEFLSLSLSERRSQLNLAETLQAFILVILSPRILLFGTMINWLSPVQN